MEFGRTRSGLVVVGIDLVYDFLFRSGHLVVIEPANLGFVFMYHVTDPYGSMTLRVGIAEAFNHVNLVRFYVSDIAYVINIEKPDEVVNLFLVLFSFGLADIFVSLPAGMRLQPVFYSVDVFAVAIFEVEHEDGFFFVGLLVEVIEAIFEHIRHAFDYFAVGLRRNFYRDGIMMKIVNSVVFVYRKIQN